MSKSQSAGRVARKKARNEVKRAAKRAALSEQQDTLQIRASRLPRSSLLPVATASLTTHGFFSASHHHDTSAPLIFKSLSSRASDGRGSHYNNHSRSFLPDESLNMTNKKKPRQKSLSSAHVTRHMQEAEACPRSSSRSHHV